MSDKLSNLGERASSVLNTFLQQGQKKGINLQELKKKNLELSKGLNEETAIYENFSLTLDQWNKLSDKEREDFRTKWKALDEATRKTKTDAVNARQEDRFEIAAEGIDYLMKVKNSKGKEIGEDGLLTADETKDAFLAIQQLDGDKDKIAIPAGDEQIADTFSASRLTERDKYKEEVLFSTLIKASRSTGTKSDPKINSNTDVNQKYLDDNGQLKVNLELESDGISVNSDKQDVINNINNGRTGTDDASFDQGVVASFQSDLAALKGKKDEYKGLSGASIIDYCELFIKYVKLFPGPSGTKWLASQFISNIGGTFTFLDPFSPIYSSFYLPFDSPDSTIKQLNVFLSTIYADRVQKIASGNTSKSVNFILEGKTETGESLLSGSGKDFLPDDFDTSVKQYFKVENINDQKIPLIVRELSGYLRGNKPATWQAAKQAASNFLKGRGGAEAEEAQGMFQALGLDSETSKIVLFIDIVTDNLKRLQETLKAKQEAAKAVLNQLQKGFQQPGAKSNSNP